MACIINNAYAFLEKFAKKQNNKTPPLSLKCDLKKLLVEGAGKLCLLIYLVGPCMKVQANKIPEKSYSYPNIFLSKHSSDDKTR